jgi:DNA sulfur modification protein DndC
MVLRTVLRRTMRTLSLFEEERLTLPKSIELSAESLRHYGSFYKHWAIAFSGGKDSSATVTLVAHLLETGQVPMPESLTILYADTRQELPPLHTSALNILDALKNRLQPLFNEGSFETRVVLPELDHRYFVYILGRGVPPPSNTFRWCTPKLKVMSMERELEALRQKRGEKFLMLTGVRIGESAARDQRIAVSCTKDRGVWTGLVPAFVFWGSGRHASAYSPLAGLPCVGLVASCRFGTRFSHI